MKLSFTYRFEAAHRLSSAASPKCQTPHGHTWKVALHLQAVRDCLNAQQMVVEFATAKKKWRSFIQETVDHSFFHHEKDSIVPSMTKEIKNFRGLSCPGDPTTEIIACLLLKKAEVLLQELTPHARVSSLTLQETPVNRIRVSVNSPIYKNVLAQAGHGWWSNQKPDQRD